MQEIERAVIMENGDTGYFKDVVARQDIVETKRMIEELNNSRELTKEEVKDIYNELYGEIFD